MAARTINAWTRSSGHFQSPPLALIHSLLCWYTAGLMDLRRRVGLRPGGKELVQVEHDRLVPQAFACLGAPAEEKRRTGLMLEQVNQNNILPLDMPLGSCSLRPGCGNRGGKRQLRCQQLCLLGASVAFTSTVLGGENRANLASVLRACSCSLCFPWAAEPCSLWYVLRVTKFTCRGNVFY